MSSHHHHHHHHHHRHAEMEQHREDPSIPAWIHAAQALTIHDLLRRRSREFSTGVISLSPNTTISKALEMLQVHDILSAPVFRDRELLGLVDVLDVARFALDFWTQRVARNEWRGFEHSTEEFFQYPVIDVLNYSKLDPPFVVSQRTTVAEAIRLFGGRGAGDGKGMLRPHRVVVLNDNGLVVSILSQSDLVHFIHSTKDTLPAPLKARTMRSLNQVNGCVSVRLDNPFSDTLELLYRNKISAVALLDDQYRICGNFSASDLRGISPKSFSFFEGSTIQFLTKGTKSGLGAAIWVGEDDSLEKALDTLVENKVHRVYITNVHGLPSGVFSLSDVMAIFAYLITHAPQ